MRSGGLRWHEAKSDRVDGASRMLELAGNPGSDPIRRAGSTHEAAAGLTIGEDQVEMPTCHRSTRF
jgi:hypothetical protein